MSCVKLRIPAAAVCPQDRLNRHAGYVCGQYIIAKFIQPLQSFGVSLCRGFVLLGIELVHRRSGSPLGHSSCPCRLALGQLLGLGFDFGLFFEHAAVVVGHYFDESPQLVVPVSEDRFGHWRVGEADVVF